VDAMLQHPRHPVNTIQETYKDFHKTALHDKVAYFLRARPIRRRHTEKYAFMREFKQASRHVAFRSNNEARHGWLPY
jgi:hypothetical protein